MEKGNRGSNYTEYEKEVLLEIIRKFNHIIENKQTNATIILKKRQAWDAICQECNAMATSGLRQWSQLRHLYENLKQRARKNVVKENKVNLMKIEDKGDIKDIKKKASDDKKEISKTGGGQYRCVLTDADHQILAMIAPQVKPLENPYDDAAEYFGDVNMVSAHVVELSDDGPANVDGTYVDDQVTIDAVQSELVVCTEGTSRVNNFCMENDGCIENVAETTPQTTPRNPGMKKTFKNKFLVKNKKEIASKSLKNQYFKLKIGNAKLERKYLIEKSRLELEILKCSLNKIKQRK